MKSIYFFTLDLALWLPLCIRAMNIFILFIIVKPVRRGVQVGSPEPPFKINDIHSKHVVGSACIYTSSCITEKPFTSK